MYCPVQTLHAFKAKFGALPRPWNKEDAGKFVEVAKEVNSKAEAKVRAWSVDVGCSSGMHVNS